MMRSLSLLPVSLVVLAASTAAPTVYAASATSSLDKVLSATASSSSIPASIPEVRAQALKQLGMGLGSRAGLVDESRAILREIDKEKTGLDTKFNFGSLTFSNGALPPVIEESKDVISVTDYSMRVQGRVYRIVSPASFLQNNWRNYLSIGLANDDDPIVGDAQRSILPKTEEEKQYWERVVREAYEEGKQQAREIFNLNLARLERDFNGMRLFYTLYSKGLVSAPKFAAATEGVSRPDPNTIVIGDSMFRITAQPIFNATPSEWKATK